MEIIVLLHPSNPEGKRVAAQGAVIFDMDGVLVDSEPLHERALTAILAERGHLLHPDEYTDLVGLSQSETWSRLSSRFGLPADLSGYQAAYGSAVIRLLREPLTPEPGAVELVRTLRQEGWKLALASSSPSPWVSATLAGLGLARAFDVVVGGDQVSRGKPDPEIFLMAAARLGVPPERCVVIEDSPHGVEAARRAGTIVVAVRTRYTAGLTLPAHYVVDSLLQLLPVRCRRAAESARRAGRTPALPAPAQNSRVTEW